jgi:hypothetical protein
MAESIRPEAALLLMGFLTFIFLIAVFLCLRVLPRPEWGLISVGLLTTLLATFVAIVSPGHAINLANQGREISFGSGASGPLGRVGVLLVLGGVALSVLGRIGYPEMSAYRERQREEGFRESR